MMFKIIKSVDNIGIMYWTVPCGIIYKIFCVYTPIYYLLFGSQSPYDCWRTLEEAEEHVERWNSGYYKRKYKETLVKVTGK